MKVYCQSRLQNVQINVKAIIKRLKDLKVHKRKGGKSSRQVKSKKIVVDRNKTVSADLQVDQNQAVSEIADPETRNETPLPSQADH